MADSFEQGLHGFNSIPRRRLGDQPKLSEMIKVLKAVDLPTDRTQISKLWADIKGKVLGDGFKVGIKSILGEQVAAAAVATFGGTYGKLFPTEIEEEIRRGRRPAEGRVGGHPQRRGAHRCEDQGNPGEDVRGR